jgi:hypothetical protein
MNLILGGIDFVLERPGLRVGKLLVIFYNTRGLLRYAPRFKQKNLKKKFQKNFQNKKRL